MDWLEAHGLTLGLLFTVLVHWGRMETRMAVLQRDMQWMRAQLSKLGFVAPNSA
jgi:hypothetical protein